MSWRALDWAWRQQLPPLAKLVLLALADHHNDDTGRCNPGLARLSERTGLPRCSVQRATTELQAAGLISTTPGGGRASTTYALAIDNERRNEGRHYVAGVTAPLVTERRRSSDTMTPQGRQGDPLRGDTVTPEPFLNRKGTFDDASRAPQPASPDLPLAPPMVGRGGSPDHRRLRRREGGSMGHGLRAALPGADRPDRRGALAAGRRRDRDDAGRGCPARHGRLPRSAYEARRPAPRAAALARVPRPRHGRRHRASVRRTPDCEAR